MTPQPGDFAVVNTGGRTSRLITAAERLDDWVNRDRSDSWDEWDHAVVCVKAGERFTTKDGWYNPPMIVEAEPGGAVRRQWHYEDRPHAWSTGIIPLTPQQGAAISIYALDQLGTGYGWLDYVALIAHGLGIPAPGMKNFIASTRTMICSQLVDACYVAAGVRLFTDDRWPGYVKPSDLGELLR